MVAGMWTAQLAVRLALKRRRKRKENMDGEGEGGTTKVADDAPFLLHRGEVGACPKSQCLYEL
jgi:hypothetical protein